MGGILDDLERQIDRAQAEAQERKLRQAQERAKQEAQRLEALRRKNENNWLL
jgi:hypothetical protein